MHWRHFDHPAPYQQTVAAMQALAAAIRNGAAGEAVWLLEHPPLYTAGTSARPEDLLDPQRLPVHQVRRGGQYTYHGPGQRVIYTMLDLKKRAQPQKGADIRRFMRQMERWIIETLAIFGVVGHAHPQRIGIWVDLQKYHQQNEAKIAALGVQISHGVSSHGASINLNPDLSHYDGIVACGLHDYGVTSLEALGIKATMADLDQALQQTFTPIFGD